ncbi:hypothetical protein PAMA_016547 [Pampus argenteus]
MASQAAGRDVPNDPRDEPDSSEPQPNHPEPACQEAQKWIEAVTGKSFGDKDFRSALENGILLCELLSAIKPGLVKKINRLPTPIAGLDNLSVFLRGCEELGLRGSQLFDPGDLQDTSIRANLKDSDCNRKLKNVLNTMFWLGKAASGCASYSGPTLNLREFEGLLAQMKVVSEQSEKDRAGRGERETDSGAEEESDEGQDSSQKRGVRDSGYDCWDSERSESLSPPRHTRDNSLDSLDSFGSRSQHSPSPDVVNRGNSDGRGSDSEADAPSRKPDVRKDDMLARRTASSESRSSIPFNQFLPNRTNASSYIPTQRRKPHTDEGEQRSHPQATPEQVEGKRLHFKTPKTVTWAPENNGEQLKHEEEKVAQDMLEQRRLQKLEKAGIKVLPAAVRYSSPPTMEEQEVRSPSPNIILRRHNDFLSSQKSAWDSSSDGEEQAEVQKVPDVRRDDLASRRAPRGPVAPKVHQFVPPPVCSNKDRERWEGIRRASQQTLQEKEISEKEAVPDIITRRDNPFLKSTPRHGEDEEDEEEEGEEGRVKAMPNKQKDDLAHRRAQSRPLPHREGPMSFASASMSQADIQKWERLKMTEPSEASPAPVCQACLEKNYGSPFSGSAKAGRGHSKVVTFGGVTEIEQPIDTVTSREGEETELLRRLLSKATVAMPTIGLGSQLSERERSQVEGDNLSQTAPHSADLPPWTPEATLSPAELDACLAQYEKRTEEEEEEEEERIPDLKKDDMMARRTGVFHKQSTATASYNRFLPLPASKRCTQAEDNTDAAPRNKKKVQADRSKKLNVRVEQQQPSDPMETPQPQPDTTVIRSTSHTEREYDDEDEYDENEPAPDLEKDDMMARRMGSSQKTSVARTNQCYSQFLPVPGSVKYNISPVSDMKQLHSRPKLPEKMASERMSQRVAFMSEDSESASMSDILNEDEVGHLPPLSQSRYERMHEQYSNFQDDEDQWQNELARWKNRRRSASQELIKKEEERKRMEKRMKEEGSECNKRKSIKTYKEIVEEKERREAELCEAYRNAATPEEAAMVLQRYALRFTISDATLDSLKLPRSTSKPEPDPNQVDEEHKPVHDSETLKPLHKPESTVITDQKHTEPKDMETTAQQETLVAVSSSSSPPKSPLPSVTHLENMPPQSQELHEPQTQPIESLTYEQPITGDAQLPTKQTPPQIAQVESHTTPPVHTLPSPPPVASRPVPLLAAKPYCQPRSSQSGHKPVKMDGLVRVNGEATEDLSGSTPPVSPLHLPEEKKDVPSKQVETEVPSEQTAASQESTDQSSPQQMEKPTSSSGSAISSLLGGRNCIVTTTIVTELTQTHVEPHPLHVQSNGQVNGTMGSFGKPAEEKKSQPVASPSSMQEYSPTVTEGLEESGVTEQYQREQEKLKKEWEKAQLEVEEEERKHNEEERRILEETATPLNPSSLFNQQSAQTETTSSAPGNNETEDRNVPLQQTGQRMSTGNDDQHASKLHFFQDSACDGEPSQKQDLWKTASLDRNPQLNQANNVKRSGSHDGVIGGQQSSSSSPQPPSPSRCVSGKRLCSGCSQPLGKGAAMIIDTLGLFFHMQCFKCGVCEGQLGDATAGTDVRIRNGLLSCHDCYIASRGRGQPTTL